MRTGHVHHRSLRHDLALTRARSLQPPLLVRRRALGLLGGAGAAAVVAACGSRTSSDPTTATTAPRTTELAGTTGAPVPTDRIPEEMAGPFPADGSNGPNVLEQSGIVRSDIRSSFGGLSGAAAGQELGVDLTLVRAADGAPLSGAALYLWQCDQDGAYSLYSDGATEQNYLRGVQEAKGNGTLSFTTIYPAVYPGRWPHLHLEVFDSLDGAAGGAAPKLTSQIAFPEETSHEVYRSVPGYEQSVANLDRVSLEGDMVFADGHDLQMPAVSGDLASGLRIQLTMAI